ncbi:MAG: hypothetical protein FJW20_14675 [Acidimicrobiia bacterium]|nr:hypothetical protein [Acidimicrobiia bacterium]
MRRRRREQRGFALLFVFMMAAAVAILLYREMPRVVFEGQREKEQLLIDRGEEYKRAIQLYVRSQKKYPASLDELEKMMDMRFLRRRYKDPLTGKDEWRVINIDAAGALTNSLVEKPPDPFGGDKDKEKKETEQQAGVFGVQMGLPGPQNDAAAMFARRGGDRPAIIAGQQGQFPPYDPNAPYNPNQPYDPNAPPPPPQPTDPNQQPVEGQPLPGQPYPGLPPQPGQQPFPGQPVFPGQPFPQQPGQPIQIQPGQPFPQQPGGLPPGQPSPFPFPALQPQPGQPGVFTPVVPGQPGLTPQPFNPFGGAPTQPANSQTGGAVQRAAVPGAAPGSNQAIDLIQRLLTTPRAGGPPGGAQAQPQGMGAGVAGVASTAEGVGIKIYNEREKFKEWEFVYDFRKDKSGAAATGQAGNLAGFGGQPGQPGQSGPQGQPGQPQQPASPMSPGSPSRMR